MLSMLTFGHKIDLFKYDQTSSTLVPFAISLLSSPLSFFFNLVFLTLFGYIVNGSQYSLD